MLEDVIKRLPQEACGLVAGHEGISTGIFPVSNILASPKRYRMSPTEQIRWIWYIEERGWELAAIYHSHPQGPSGLSHTDVREAGYPDAIQLVVSPGADGFQVRGFVIDAGVVKEVGIHILPHPSGG